MTKIIKSALALYSFIFSVSFVYHGLSQLRSTADIIAILFIVPPLIYFTVRLLEFVHVLRTGIKGKVVLSINKPSAQMSLVSTALFFAICLFGMVLGLQPVILLLVLPLPLYFVLKNLEPKVEIHITPPITQSEVVKVRNWLDVASASSDIELPLESAKKEEVLEDITHKEAGVNDARRRQFLKVLGTTSVGLLIATLLNPKSAEAAFFGSVPGPGTVALKDLDGNKIDPAIKSPTDAYGISEVDSTGPYYYGYVNKVGNWYIVREGDDGTFRYTKGDSNFSSEWTSRAALSYGYYNTAF